MGGAVLRMFFLSLSLTLLIESAVALVVGVRGKGLCIVWLVNTLTNPAIVYLVWVGRGYFKVPAEVLQIPLEILVTAVEAFVYSRFVDKPGWGLDRPIFLSVLANGVSWGLGFLQYLL